MIKVNVGDLIAADYTPNIRCDYRVNFIHERKWSTSIDLELIRTEGDDEHLDTIRKNRTISLANLYKRIKDGSWRLLGPLEQLADAAE